MTGQPLHAAAELIGSVRAAQDGLLACWEALAAIPGYPLDDSLAANLRSLAADRAAEEDRTLRDRITAARKEGDYCCDLGCRGGGCETGPCCCAGWCVSGGDGQTPFNPDSDASDEDRDIWLAVAAQHNPVAAALAAAQEREQRVAEFRIVGTWLIEEVGHHTCGTERGGHFGAHEPGCGQEPVINLAAVPGFAALVGERAAQ